MQSVPIGTNVTSSNLEQSEVYSIQQYVIKFVSNLRQVDGFLWVLQFSPGTPVSSTNKAYPHDIAEILLKVALNTITHQNFRPRQTFHTFPVPGLLFLHPPFLISVSFSYVVELYLIPNMHEIFTAG